MESMGGGMMTPPPTDPSAGGNPDAPRAYLVTLRCTTPFRGPGKDNKYVNGVDFVQKEFVDQLMKIAPNPASPHMEYKIEKAVITAASPIKEDAQRMQEIKTAFQAAMNAQQNPGSGMPTGGGYQPQMGGMAMDGMGAGMPYRPGAEFGPGGFNPGGFAPGGNNPDGMGGQAGPDESQFFQDRLTQEDVREDWQVTVRFLVVVEPPDYAPPAAPEAVATQ